ncbi:hypothetical protein [Halomonas ventosae]|uniref:Uncharacterized protein n=1 Tax=Halomonas ventosae TaxID=229007 RepID=A0A2T0VK99_9GAMM|nr:hypothetical protein [Halomonas ventosae]PRY70651.1 hypothetical protein BCL64_11217 [Halomonas ventosae]
MTLMRGALCGQALIRGFVEQLVRCYFPTEAPAAAAAPDDPARYAGDYLPTRRPYTTVEALLNHDMASVHLDRDGRLVLSRRGRQVGLVPAPGEASRHGHDQLPGRGP